MMSKQRNKLLKPSKASSCLLIGLAGSFNWIKKMRKRIMPQKHIYYCSICGEPIPEYRGNRVRYCSDSCSVEAAKRNDRAKAYVDKTPYLKMRFKILVRDEFTCQYCGRGVKDKIKLEVDHIKPFSKGGTNTINNLITSCLECNNGKKDILLSQRLERKLKESLAQK